MKVTRKKIERIANAIKFMVPTGGSDCTLSGCHISGWTPKGLAEVKWPKDFGPNERAVIRLIAKTAIETLAGSK